MISIAAGLQQFFSVLFNCCVKRGPKGNTISDCESYVLEVNKPIGYENSDWWWHWAKSVSNLIRFNCRLLFSKWCLTEHTEPYSILEPLGLTTMLGPFKVKLKFQVSGIMESALMRCFISTATYKSTSRFCNHSPLLNY